MLLLLSFMVVRYVWRMEHYQIASVVRDRLKQQGRAAYRAALDAGLPDNAIRYVLEGRATKSDRLIEVCDALGLEFYIGPPREGSDSAFHEQTSDRRDTENLRAELEVMRKAEAQAEALRAEIASTAARLEAVMSGKVDTTRRIREPELIIPTLILLATRHDGVATTRDIIRHMEYWFQPAGEDAEPLKGRSDSRFSQIVRNMISHRKDAGSFIRNGYAEYLSDLQGLRITDKGRKLLKEVVNEG